MKNRIRPNQLHLHVINNFNFFLFLLRVYRVGDQTVKQPRMIDIILDVLKLTKQIENITKVKRLYLKRKMTR